MKSRIVLGVALCLFLVGCDDSKTPLSDPGASKPDPRLAGVWRLQGKGGQVSYYHIGFADDKLPAGVMRVVAVTHKDGKLEPPSYLLMFPTTLGGKTYLNLTSGKEGEVKRIEDKGWKAADSYLIFKYRVEGNKLLVWVMDGNAKKRAIEAGKIKGVIKEHQPARFTDTTKNLARFVAAEDKALYPNEPIRLERIAPPK
jgi:hypothetical protein